MSPQVQLQYGQVEGEQRGKHLAFRGIPFARPPIGPLRFLPPQPPEPWGGVRVTREFGPSAPQSISPLAAMAVEGGLNEDCLYLNVYTPASDRTKRPVMFWIHGGGFTTGAGSQALYDGGRLVERGDVVVVTINYRLGALGYLHLATQGGERWGAAANLGQLDQIAGLKWVRDNIEAFGGDPNNVTIFGESAGSMAVCTLLAMPAAQGLFHRAIAQSGASLSVVEPDAAAKVAEALLAELGIPATESQRLQQVPAERIVAAQAAVAVGARGFSPVLDPGTLPQHPSVAFASGQGAKVPFVIGSNRDEVNLFQGPALKELDKPMDDARAIEVLRKQLPRRAGDRIGALLEIYRNSRKARGLPHSNRALLGAIQTDLRFRIPSIRYAEAYRQQQRDTFMYFFVYESPAMRGAMRSCHALELPFVFGTLDAPDQERFAGKGPVVEALSETMMDTWLSFARRGNPSHPRVGDWVPYDRDRRATMVFDKKTSLQDAPYEEERVAWDGIL